MEMETFKWNILFNQTVTEVEYVAETRDVLQTVLVMTICLSLTLWFLLQTAKTGGKNSGRTSMAELFYMTPASYQSTEVFEPRLKKHRNALYTAAENGRLNRVSLLLALGRDPDRKDPYGITPLQIAAWNNHCKVVHKLAKRGSDVNLADRLGHTAMFKSVWQGCERCVNSLLCEDARVDIQDHSGNTPLMLAAELGHIQILDTLLKSGAKTEARNKWGESALYIAAAHSNLNGLQLLLQYGADPDARTLESCTPLFAAVSRRRSQKTTTMVELLLQAGASLDLKGKDSDVNYGKAVTPFEMACYMGNFELAQLLAAAGSSMNPVRNWRRNRNWPGSFRDNQDYLQFFKNLSNSPPTLASLSRTTIRQDLLKKRQLDATILGLPRALVDYVECRDIFRIASQH